MPIRPATDRHFALGLCHVLPQDFRSPPPHEPTSDPQATRHVDAAEKALGEYFAGGRRDFADLAIAPSGSPFQQRVWEALCAIPFGRTASYGEIARHLGCDDAARAVGSANHRNPLSIVVPCHRVIGADGSLSGYAGGVDRKRWLLSHEGGAAWESDPRCEPKAEM